MRIGLDLDGVCFDFLTPFLAYLNKELGTNHKAEQINNYRWYQCLPGLTVDQFYKLLSRWDKEDGWRTCKMFPGVALALKRRVLRGDTLHVITARTSNGPAAAEEALIDDLVYVTDIRTKALNQRKDVLARELNVDVYLEDRTSEAEAVAKAGVPVILISQLYNLEWIIPCNLPIVRAESARAAIESLDQLVSLARSVKKS